MQRRELCIHSAVFAEAMTRPGLPFARTPNFRYNDRLSSCCESFYPACSQPVARFLDTLREWRKNNTALA
jgi:hypothetical protein